MGPWEMLKRFLILTVIVSSKSEFTHLDVVLNRSVTLPCKGAVSEDTPPQEYDVKWETENDILVAHYHQGELTAGDWFKGRVSISEEDIGFGKFSLKINSVEYSDQGLYMCRLNGKRHADVRLEVLVPTVVSARLGEPATLPCYVQVDKTQNSNINPAHWEKDGEPVLLLQSGLFNKSSGCENRCSMSEDGSKFGNWSMTISEVRHSDQGTYRCISTGKTVNPDIIILTIEVHHNITNIQSGQSLWLQLYSSDPVRVVFQPNENSSTVPVCTVKGESVDCVPQYQHRVSIQNRTLKLDSVTPNDRGVYRVIDHKTNETISSVTVLHTADPPATAGNTWLWVLLVVLVVLVLLVVVVVLVKMKRCPRCTWKQSVSLASMVYPGVSQEGSEPWREMASLATGQPVEENGEEEQLSVPVRESGDTEDKRGPQPWNDDDSEK